MSADFREFVENVRLYGLEFYDRYYGVYKAEVVDNDDPEDRGRVRVRVPMLQVDGDAAIPNWALPAGGAPINRADGRGTYNVPAEGDQVWVRFQGGDVDVPVYEPGGFHAEDEIPDDFKLPDDRGWKTRGGHYLRFRDADDDRSIRVQHASGTRIDLADGGAAEVRTHKGDRIELDPAGAVAIEHRGGPRVEIDGSTVVAMTADGAKFELGPDGARVESSPKIVLQSKRIVADAAGTLKLGESASSPVPKGDVLADWLQKFYQWAAAHTHPTPQGPTSPSPQTPPPPPGPSMLSKLSKTE